jgi:hypothetical protein
MQACGHSESNARPCISPNDVRYPSLLRSTDLPPAKAGRITHLTRAPEWAQMRRPCPTRTSIRATLPGTPSAAPAPPHLSGDAVSQERMLPDIGAASAVPVPPRTTELMRRYLLRRQLPPRGDWRRRRSAHVGRVSIYGVVSRFSDDRTLTR